MTQLEAGASPISSERSRTIRNPVIFGLGIFAAAVATRLAHLDAAPFYDEFYHILAATSWLEDGTFAVYEGEYPRAPLYTVLTGWMFALAGEPNITMARAPNVLFGALLATGSALWTRHVAGPVAGWIVALCALMWPSGIHLSQIIRFYAVHGLLFFAGAVAVYELLRPAVSVQRRLPLAALALTAFWLAYQFQVSTLVGVLGVAVWAVLFLILPGILRLRQWRLILIGATAAAALLAVGAASTGLLGEMWAKYNISPWERDPTAYHRVLRETYPLLWPVTPVLAIFALRDFFRPATLCVTLVVCGILLHSFSGVQNIRYIYYLSPFLFAIWAMGIQAILPAVITHLRAALAFVAGPFSSRGAIPAILICVGLFAVFSNAAATRSVKLMMGGHAAPMHQVANWAEARRPVSQYAEDGAFVVATNDLAAIHYLGGFDAVFSKNWLPSMNGQEFALDTRTGRPLISRVESLRDLVQTYPEGLFLASRNWWSSWPSSNSVTALLGAFNAPNVDWSIERAGPISILHWRTDVYSGSNVSTGIREIIGAP